MERRGQAGAKYEIKKLHLRYTFNRKHYKEINEEQKKSILNSHMFPKEKRDDTIKGRTVAGGKKQRYFISKVDSRSSMVSTEGVILSCIIDA